MHGNRDSSRIVDFHASSYLFLKLFSTPTQRLSWRGLRRRCFWYYELHYKRHCNVSTRQRLQRVQNRAARAVLNAPPRTPSLQLLQQLHWLRIKARISYKLCSLMYRVVHRSAPIYLIELCRVELIHPHFHCYKNCKNRSRNARVIIENKWYPFHCPQCILFVLIFGCCLCGTFTNIVYSSQVRNTN